MVVNPAIGIWLSPTSSDDDDDPNAPLDAFSIVELSPIQDAASSLITAEWSTGAESQRAPDSGGCDDDVVVQGSHVCEFWYTLVTYPDIDIWLSPARSNDDEEGSALLDAICGIEPSPIQDAESSWYTAATDADIDVEAPDDNDEDDLDDREDVEGCEVGADAEPEASIDDDDDVEVEMVL
jgi:hypothetical protein